VTKQVSSKSVLEEDERKAAFPKDRERARRSNWRSEDVGVCVVPRLATVLRRRRD